MDKSTESFIQKYLESTNCTSLTESFVMAMVQRIMYEAMDVCNDTGIDIYGRTHDTIVVDVHKIDILKQKYKERYGWELSRHFLIKGAFLTVQ